MLTSIKIEGYKSLKDASVKLEPLTVFLGKNNVGKSNLFDALRLLSNLAQMPVAKAFSQAHHRGDPNESFFSSESTTLRFELELNLSAAIHPFKKEGKLYYTDFTYTIEIHYDESSGSLTVQHETLTGKTGNGKDVKPLIESIDGKIIVSRDDGSGNKRKFSLPSTRSVLLTIDDSELYTSVSAVREELASWKFFHFEPNALREPSQKLNVLELENDGKGLSGFYDTLKRVDKPRFDAAIVGLRRAIPDADTLDVVETGDNRLLLQLTDVRGKTFTARVLSDGTLRFLALLALAHSPKPPSLASFEEPENGVHPGKLKFTVDTLRAIATKTKDGVSCQVLVNSHSPYLVDQLQKEESVLVENTKGYTEFSLIKEMVDKTHLSELLEDGEQTLGEIWASEGLSYGK
jgi:predicted ATPase